MKWNYKISRPLNFNLEMMGKVLRGGKTQVSILILPQPILVNDKTYTWPLDGKGSKASWAKEINPSDCMTRFCIYQPGNLVPLLGTAELLQITQVRIERVHDLTEGDFIKEGCPKEFLLGQNWFKWAWNKNFGDKILYEQNPWVFVVSFELVLKQKDGESL